MSTKPQHSFTKAQRLLNKAAFDYVFADAKRSYCQGFTVLFRANHLSHDRLGIICGRKVDKKAHERNRIKRLIRESFRQSNDLLMIDPTLAGLTQRDNPLPTRDAVDMVVLPKPSVSDKSNTDILVMLDKHWHRIDKVVKKSIDK